MMCSALVKRRQCKQRALVRVVVSVGDFDVAEIGRFCVQHGESLASRVVLLNDRACAYATYSWFTRPDPRET